MDTRATYCRICEAACGLLADVAQGELVSLRPDPEHVVSRGFACAKGTRFGELHSSPDRLEHAWLRQHGRLVRARYEQVVADAGRRLARIVREHGPHAVGVYMGNPAAFGFTIPIFSLGFVRALGTRNSFSAGSLDSNNKFVVARHVLGSPMTHPVPDLDHASFALLIGTNPAVSQSSFVHAPRMVERLRAIEQRGGRVVIVDPRRNETARRVGEHLPVSPDTDAALLLSLLHVIFAEGLEDRRALAAHAHGEQELRAAVRCFAPEHVAPFTGIAAERIVELARSFARADGAFCHVSTGVNMGTFGNIAYAAKIALEVSTGNLDRRGGALLVHGALDTAAIAARLGLDREPPVRSRIGGLPPVLGTLPTAILPDEILVDGPERIRALVVIAGNPLSSAPDTRRMRQALSSLDTLVCLDLFLSDTAAHASHVLPCTDFLEREDLGLPMLQLQPQPYLQWTDAVVQARGERRPEWRILLDLARAAGRPLFGHAASDLALRAALAAGGPATLLAPLLLRALGPRPIARLRRHPHGLRIDRERPGAFLARRLRTPSGKLELFPAAVYARLPELQARTRATRRPAPSEPLTLSLFTKREPTGHNSWMHASSRLTTPRHAAHLSPADAERLGLGPGDRIELSSPTGRICLPVVVSADVMPGAVAVPHGYGHEPESGWTRATERGGVNVNELAPSGAEAVDPLSGMCRFVGLQVQARRVEHSAVGPRASLELSASRRA